MKVEPLVRASLGGQRGTWGRLPPGAGLTQSLSPISPSLTSSLQSFDLCGRLSSLRKALVILCSAQVTKQPLTYIFVDVLSHSSKPHAWCGNSRGEWVAVDWIGLLFIIFIFIDLEKTANV